jgi:hypothetical protein
MTYTAILWGGGDPMPGDTPDKDVGQKERVFETDEPMGFDDFEGETVRISRLDLQAVVGVTRLYLSFPGLGKEAFVYVGQKFGLGFPGGFVVAGILQKQGDSPGDFRETGTSEEVFPTVAKRVSEEGLILTFSTEQDTLPATEADRLGMFVTTTARRMGGLVPRRSP